MKLSGFLKALAVGITLFTPAMAQQVGRITSEEVFRANALDRLWLADGGHVEIFADGRLRADWGGRILSAQWQWDAQRQMMCREGDFDGAARPYECQIISLTETGMSISRFEGRGPTFQFVEAAE